MYPGGQIISGKGAIGGAGQVQKPFGEIFDKPSEGDFRKDFKGDSKGFLDNFKEGALGYFKDAQKGKSDTDKLLDFARETRGMGSGAQFGGMGGGFSTEVAEGLNVYNHLVLNRCLFLDNKDSLDFLEEWQVQLLVG